MNDNKTIHISLPKQIYEKLLVYGKGRLSTGIINLIKIAEQKEVIIKIETDVLI